MRCSLLKTLWRIGNMSEFGNMPELQAVVASNNMVVHHEVARMETLPPQPEVSVNKKVEPLNLGKNRKFTAHRIQIQKQIHRI